MTTATKNEPARPAIKFYTAAELATTRFAIEYLVDGILVAGQPAIVAGPKKSLKTSLALDLALSLATGGFFLGKFHVARQMRVGVLSGESGMGTIQETCRRICSAVGKQLGEVSNLVVSEEVPRFSSPQDRDALERLIYDQSLEVVIVDPAYMAVPGDGASNLFIMGDLLRGVSKICEQAGATLVLVHHTRKQGNGNSNPYAPLGLDDIAWAGFAEFARQWVLLNRREAYEPGSGQHRLWMGVGGSAGHGGLWTVDVDEGAYDPQQPRIWTTTVTTAAEQRQKAADQRQAKRDAKEAEKLEAAIAKTIAFLTGKPDGASKSAIKASVLKSTELTDTVLEEVQYRGLVVPCKVSAGNHQTYDGFKLAG